MQVAAKNGGLGKTPKGPRVTRYFNACAGNLGGVFKQHVGIYWKRFNDNRCFSFPSFAKEFVISLAVSDILVAILALPLNSAVLVKSDWPFDYATCQFQGHFGMTLGFASSETLALMSLNRYYRNVRPNNYRRIFTARQTSIMFVAAWVIASLGQLPYVAAGHRY